MTFPTDVRADVHDTLQLGAHAWAITGVFIGGLNQEDVLGLQVLTGHDATAYGKSLPELFVPEALIRAAIDAGILALHKAPEAKP